MHAVSVTGVMDPPIMGVSCSINSLSCNRMCISVHIGAEYCEVPICTYRSYRSCTHMYISVQIGAEYCEACIAVDLSASVHTTHMCNAHFDTPPKPKPNPMCATHALTHTYNIQGQGCRRNGCWRNASINTCRDW